MLPQVPGQVASSGEVLLAVVAVELTLLVVRHLVRSEPFFTAVDLAAQGTLQLQLGHFRVEWASVVQMDCQVILPGKRLQAVLALYHSEGFDREIINAHASQRQGRMAPGSLASYIYVHGGN